MAISKRTELLSKPYILAGLLKVVCLRDEWLPPGIYGTSPTWREKRFSVKRLHLGMIFQLTLDGLGETYRIHDVSTKAVTSCRHSHPQIDAACEITRQPGFDPLEIASVNVFTYGAAVAVAGGKGEYPNVSADAKFHSPYCIARVLQNGTIGLHDFEQTVIESDETRKHQSTGITIEIGEEFERRFPEAWGAKVDVRMTDDRLFSSGSQIR